MTHPRQLRTLHDRQHDFRRLAEENKLHQGRRRANPSNILSQSGSSSHLTVPVAQNMRIQSMVSWRQQYGCRCPLPGQWPVRQRTHQNPSFSLPLTGSKTIENCCTSCQQDNLMADLSAALAARQAAVGGGTHKNDAWCRIATSTALDSEAITSSTECTDSTELKSWEHLPWLCVKGNFHNRVMVPWLKTHSQIPSMMWLRPSGEMDK
jgi:hypothetical protein